MYYKLNVCFLLITKCDPLRRKEALVTKVERVRMAEMNIFTLYPPRPYTSVCKMDLKFITRAIILQSVNIREYQTEIKYLRVNKEKEAQVGWKLFQYTYIYISVQLLYLTMVFRSTET
jgi:hypothetical protein